VPIFGNYCKFHYDFNLKPQIKKNIYFHVKTISTDKGKGKAIPLQPWTGPEGSRRLRFPDFKTIDT